jgi:hypothetical protein
MKATGSALRFMKIEPGLPSGRSSPSASMRKRFRLGVQVNDTYEQEYRWSELYRLTQLSNLDKHRRLTLMAWWPDLVYWMSNGPSQRRWLGGDGTFADGSVLGYMAGQDADVGRDRHRTPTNPRAGPGRSWAGLTLAGRREAGLVET